MTYACVECRHEIASDAYRCPNCGTENAGSRAQDLYHEVQRREREREKDRTDPGWREREDAERKLKSARDEYKTLWFMFWITYYLYLLPLITIISILLWVGKGDWGAIVMVIPGINWLIFLMAVINNEKNNPALYIILAWAVIGVIVAFVTRPRSAP